MKSTQLALDETPRIHRTDLKNGALIPSNEVATITMTFRLAAFAVEDCASSVVVAVAIAIELPCSLPSFIYRTIRAQILTASERTC